MIAVDTNVLVRLLVNDDADQSHRAARLFVSDDVFIAKTVLLETEWVLRFTYTLKRPTIEAAFTRLCDASSIVIESASAVRTAVGLYAAGMDFADALHVASSAEAETFITFDKKLGRAAARAKTSLPVEVI